MLLRIKSNLRSKTLVFMKISKNYYFYSELVELNRIHSMASKIWIHKERAFYFLVESLSEERFFKEVKIITFNLAVFCTEQTIAGL